MSAWLWHCLGHGTHGDAGDEDEALYLAHAHGAWHDAGCTVVVEEAPPAPTMTDAQRRLAGAIGNMLAETGAVAPAQDYLGGLIVGMILALGLTDTQTAQPKMRDSLDVGMRLLDDVFVAIVSEAMIEAIEEVLADEQA